MQKPKCICMGFQTQDHRVRTPCSHASLHMQSKFCKHIVLIQLNVTKSFKLSKDSRLITSFQIQVYQPIKSLYHHCHTHIMNYQEYTSEQQGKKSVKARFSTVHSWYQSKFNLSFYRGFGFKVPWVYIEILHSSKVLIYPMVGCSLEADYEGQASFLEDKMCVFCSIAEESSLIFSISIQQMLMG